MKRTPSALVAGCAAALLLFLAGCGKDKEAEQPAELVDLKSTLEVRKLWDRNLGGDAERLRLALGLAFDRGVLFAASRDGRVEALDPATGRAQWSVATKAALSAGPGVGGGRVVVGSSDGSVLAFDAEGKRLWQANVAGEVLATPLVARDRVIVRTVDGKLRSLDATSGREQWSTEEPVPRLTLRGNAPPVLAGDAVLAGFDSGKVVAFALASGDVLWQSQVSTPRGRSELERLADVDSAVHVEDGDGYAVGYQGRVVMFALDTGQVWWGRELSSYRGLALDAEQLYVAAADGSVVAMRRRDGSELWQQDALRRRRLGAPAVIGDAVVVGDLEGYLHFLDRSDGKPVARQRAGGERVSAAPVVDGQRLFAITEGGRISAWRVGGAASGT